MSMQVIKPSHLERLHPGLIFEWNGQRFEILSINEAGQCLAKCRATGSIQSIETNHLLRNALHSAWVDLSRVSAKEWNRAKALAKAVALVIAGQITDSAELRRRARTTGLGITQFRRYIERYRQMPLVTSCLPGRGGRPRGKRLLDAAVEAVIDQARRAALAKAEETTLDEIVHAVEIECGHQKLTAPSRDTVHRRLVSAGFSLRKRRQLGPHKYRESCRQLHGSNHVQRFGDQFQIDHTQLDIMVLDEERKHVLGRPWLTLVLDVATRCVMGFYVSFAAPSMESTARALVMAVSDKSRVLQDLRLSQFDWPMAGLPRKILTDCGADFRSRAFRFGCEQHGIEAALRMKPSDGGHIERALGTFNNQLHQLRGTTFSNYPKRIKYDAAARAIFTGMELLRHLVCQFIEHHDTRHSSLNVTPRMAWEASLADAATEVRTPVMPRFYYDFLKRVSSVRQRDGLHWGGYRFNSKILANIPVGKTATYRVDLQDTSKVFLELDGQLVEVPRVVPVTYVQHGLERQLRALEAARCDQPVIADRRAKAMAEKRSIEATAKLETAITKRRDMVQPSPVESPQSSVLPQPGVPKSLPLQRPADLPMLAAAGKAQRPSAYSNYARLSK